MSLRERKHRPCKGHTLRSQDWGPVRFKHADVRVLCDKTEHRVEKSNTGNWHEKRYP